MANTPDTCRLYLISPATLELAEFRPRLKEALAAGDVASFQLRLKGLPDEEICRIAEQLLPLCYERDVAFILNDRADLARDVGADGVHLGQGDGSVEEARTLLGMEGIIGVTCHNSRHLAFLAGEAGADYVAFGAFYPTQTKKTEYIAEPEILAWWSEIAEIPCVAIGGISPENARPLVKAGAHFLAVSSAVWDHPEGPGAAVKAFRKILKN